MINPESRAMQGLSALADLFALSICFFFTCLPLVTVGPACIAMYRVMKERMTDSGNGGVKSYFRSFVKAFRPGFVLGLLRLGVLGLLGLSIYLSGLAQQPAMQLARGVALVLFLLLFASGVCLYPQVAWFEGSLSQYIKNSLLLSLSAGLRPLLYLLLWLLPAAAGLIFPGLLLQIAFTYVMIGFSVSFVLSARIAKKILRPAWEKTSEK